MLLPERTVDIWTGCAIQRLVPGAQLWAPTTNAQGLGEPDLYVGGAGKLVLLEHKGLLDGNRITLPCLQFWRLLGLQMRFGGAVFYGLPNAHTIATRPQGNPVCTLQASFEQHLQVYQPSELWRQISGQSIPRRPLSKLATGSPYWRLESTFFAAWPQTLADLVAKARGCQLGVKVDTQARVAESIAAMDQALFEPLDPSRLREWARKQDLPDLPGDDDELRGASSVTTWRRPTLALIPV